MTLHTTRSSVRQRLARMTDAELQAECLALILRRKEALGTPCFRAAADLTQLCWETCMERGRVVLFLDADEAARAEMRRRKGINGVP